MQSTRKRRRAQRSLWMLGLCLALFYAAAYKPLSRRATDLDRPLTNVWSSLGTVIALTNGFGRDQMLTIDARLEQAERSAAVTEQLRREVAEAIRLDAETGRRVERPFQLIEFQNERQTLLEELGRAAGKQKVRLAADVVDGFPEFTADRRMPELLWPQLVCAYHLVLGAIQAQVATVSVVRIPPFQLHAAGTNGVGSLAEIPVSLELTGTASALARFLESLPLRADVIQSRGLPPALPAKPVFFVRNFLLRKEGRDQVERVRLELTACSFVAWPRELETSPP